MCAPSFLVCTRLTTCVHVHSLEGTLLGIVSLFDRSLSAYMYERFYYEGVHGCLCVHCFFLYCLGSDLIT